MRMFATTAAAGAMLMSLAACDQLGIGQMGGDNATANSAVNGAADADKDATGGNAAEAAGGKDDAGAPGAATLDRAFLVGRWTDDGNCSTTGPTVAEFRSDGRFVAANGTGGLWNLAGDRLTLTGSSTLTLQVVPIDQNTMTVVNPDGSLGRSTRC